ncbi:MAG TPA: DUF87 domain-containing protein, partial [Hyphomicrobiaceae bacterium]|nr:DUF87 domain-containing protein [Hyphomicrobiaceae bacterium]
NFAGCSSSPDPAAFFGPQFGEEFAGLSTRRLLEHAQSRLRARQSNCAEEDELKEEKRGFVSTLAAALGFGASIREAAAGPALGIEYSDAWQRYLQTCAAGVPSDDQELMDVLVTALGLVKDEWGGTIQLAVERLELGDDLPAIDLAVRHSSGYNFDARVYLCNRPTHGGGLKRQLDKLLQSMDGRGGFLLRTSDFPPNKKNQTAQAFRKFRDGGGRLLLVPILEWGRMVAAREFHAQHRYDPGFSHWCEQSKLLSGLVPMVQLLRLDLLGQQLPTARSEVSGSGSPAGTACTALWPAGEPGEPILVGAAPGAVTPLLLPEGAAVSSASDADWAGGRSTGTHESAAARDDELPLAVILDETRDHAKSIYAGRQIGGRSMPITLNKNVLKRHAAVLGGSGSGKTTLALSLIEQLLLRGTPAVLIDRKGDLCSYANPDHWRAHGDENQEGGNERAQLADAIDVAVYTPGRALGRPISITLLPTGISELPEHEQQLLANLSAAALGDMLHLKRSATHQKLSGTLSVALRILGSRSRSEVTLGDLIHLLEDEDPELTDLTQRMDPSGKLRRDLVAQLDSLRHRNSALFEGGGESLRMEALLGIGSYARPGRTRLSVIYTGFLGDNENILFWVSQFLSEALRFCQRNPNDELQAVVMLDEADLYIPANAKPATAEPLQSLLKRARSAGLGLMLATQSPGDLDYKSRDQITSWFIGRVREDTALRKLKAAFQSESGLDPAAVLPGQTVGEFHLVQEGLVRSLKARRSLINAEQVPFDRIEQLARETRGQDEKQLRLFDAT